MQRNVSLPGIRQIEGGTRDYTSNQEPLRASGNGYDNEHAGSRAARWEYPQGMNHGEHDQGYAPPQSQHSLDHDAAIYHRQQSTTPTGSYSVYQDHEYSAQPGMLGGRRGQSPASSRASQPSAWTPQPPSASQPARQADIGEQEAAHRRQLCLELADRLSNNFGLPSGLRQDLKHLADVVSPLPQADSYYRIYSLAVQLTMLYLARTKAERTLIINGKLDNILERLRANWEPSSVQKNEVRKVIRRLLCDTKRTSYSHLHEEALAAVRTDQVKLGLKDAFETATQEATLNRYIKESCPSIRGHYREHIVDSLKLKSKKHASLSKFAAFIARQYLPGVPTSAFDKNNKLVIHLAILRYLATENWKIATTANDDAGESEDWDNEQRDDTEPSAEPVDQSTRKRKRQPCATGVTWWTFVQGWYRETCAEHGTDRKSAWWNDFLQRIIRLDVEAHGGRDVLESAPRADAPAQQSASHMPAIEAEDHGRGALAGIFPSLS